MKQVDSKEAVESFLLKAHEILKDNSFDMKKNFYLQLYRNSYSENSIYTNIDTLIELNFSLQDAVDTIISFTVENYKETIIDNKEGKINPFYCFIKSINNRQVYIKIKISEEKEKQVFCVSFHFSEYYVADDALPYKK